jgi:AcrR family transcriptional regulator
MRFSQSPAASHSHHGPDLQPRKRQRHQQILDAAFEEFAARGYEAARLDDVARRAGIGKGTIYLYFKNKEGLFRAVLRDLISRSVEDFGVFAQNFSGSAEDLIRELLSRQYAHVVQNAKARSILRLLISESRQFPQLSEIYYRDIISPGVRSLRFILEKGASSGEFSRVALHKFPQILIAPGVLALVWSLIFGDEHPLDLEVYREAHLQFVLRGLRASIQPANSSAKQLREQGEAP